MGWFKIPGVQDGERTLDEQMMGLRPILPLAVGRSVLDIGCAEGLISLEFARAGASSVLGLEGNEAYLLMARNVCQDLAVRFELFDFREAVKVLPSKPDFDIVLALGVVHKLFDPADGLRYAARRARGLVALRWGRGADAHICFGKHSGTKCNALAVMEAEDFGIVEVFSGPKGRAEDVALFERGA